MKIAIITNLFFSKGGSEATIRNIIEFSKKRKIEIDIWTTDFNEEECSENFNNINIFKFPKELINISLLNFLVSKNSVENEVIKKLSKYDVLHFFMIQTLIPFIKLLKNSKILLTLQGGDIQNPRKTNYVRLAKDSEYPIYLKGFRKSLLNELFLRFFFFFYAKNIIITTISDDMYNELISLGANKNKIHLIPNGVNTDYLKKTYKSIKLSEKKKKFYVLCLGRNDSRKGFYFMLDALIELKKIGETNIRVIFKGKGFKGLIKIAKEKKVESFLTVIDEDFNIDFKYENFKNGRSNLMPDKESIYLYKFCDLVCVPSIIEGMGNVGAEAIILQKPLVVSDSFGVRFLGKFESAIYAESGNGYSIARSILKIKNNKKIRDLQSIKQRLRAKEFDFKNISDKYFELYRKISK